MGKTRSKRVSLLLVSIFMITMLAVGCSSSVTKEDATENVVTPTTEAAVTEAASETEEIKSPAEETTILIAAASSLEYSLTEELIPMFEELNPGIIVEGTYDSSGKLQTQIEEGIEADIAFFAASKQMDTLNEEGLVKAETIVSLLKNKIVLIVPSDSDLGLTAFEQVEKADKIAIGDPDSVPAGQYAKEALTTLGLWEEVSAKASLGANVTEVLNWVAEGSADAGIVYATDAATNTEGIKVIAEAPEGSLAKDVVYPVAVLTNSSKQEAAQKFVDFLASEEAVAVFESYGFTNNIE
ncbi:MAG: molybdate ABC transporter substrate-binding protein [Mobilitalea sp.]